MAYDAEKQALRELAYFILPSLRCHFCQQPFLSQAQAEAQGFGHRRHRHLAITFTMHHLDENREHNSIERNIRICHPECHKKYHKEKRHAVQESRSEQI